MPVPMLPGEEALNNGSLNLCREEKQLNLHNAAVHFRGRSSLLKRSPDGARAGFAENARAHTRRTTRSNVKGAAVVASAPARPRL